MGLCFLCVLWILCIYGFYELTVFYGFVLFSNSSGCFPAFWEPAGAQNPPSDAPFSPKKPTLARKPSYRRRPGATRDATCDPKRPWYPFSSIWDGFLMDFGGNFGCFLDVKTIANQKWRMCGLPIKTYMNQ